LWFVCCLVVRIERREMWSAQGSLAVGFLVLQILLAAREEAA
jgi:hypothetical protein